MDIKLNKLSDYYISLNLPAELKQKLFSYAAGLALSSLLRMPDAETDLNENNDVVTFYKKTLERTVNIKLSTLNESIIFDLNVAKEASYNLYMSKYDLLYSNKPKVYNSNFSFLCLVMGMNFYFNNDEEKLFDDNKEILLNLFKKIVEYFKE